jgi:hypothetical protein
MIAAATEVKVLPTPIIYAASAPGASDFEIHLLQMNGITQT